MSEPNNDLLENRPSYSLDNLLRSFRTKVDYNPFPLNDWQQQGGGIRAANLDPYPKLNLIQLIDHVRASVKTSDDAKKIYAELTRLYIDALGRPYGEAFFEIGETIGSYMALPLNLERKPNEPDLSRVSTDDLLSSFYAKVFDDPGKGDPLHIDRGITPALIDPLRKKRFVEVLSEILRRIKNTGSTRDLEKIRQKIYGKIQDIDIFGKLYIQDFLDLGIAIGNRKEELRQQDQTQTQS